MNAKNGLLAVCVDTTITNRPLNELMVDMNVSKHSNHKHKVST